MRLTYPRLALHSIFISLLVASLLLHGCTPNTTKPDTTAPPAPPTVDYSNATIEQANALLTQGKKREAAQAYYAAAARYPSPQRERVVLQAAELTAAIGDAALTNTYLASLPPTLDGENQGRAAYVRALLALQQNNPTLALQTLPQNLDNLSPALREKVKHVQQRAQAGASGRGNAAAPQPVQVQPALAPTSVNRIAALLPQSGPLGSVGREVFRGMEAARNALSMETVVQLYDISNGNAVGQYQQAVAAGADMVVGPLDKDSLAQLLAQPQILSKPILSLNYLGNNRFIPGALYQFGLSPEDEARQVAEFALARGQTTAIMLVPNSTWGDRVAQAFRTTYQSRGGQIVNLQQYPDAVSNAYVQVVQNALAATQGRAGMVFLAASPSQARMIRPLLSAQASHLPVYATSHIFSGRVDPGKDADLDGIVYTEIPWVMEAMQNGTLNNSAFPRMFAMGMDAFLIAKNLPSIARTPNALVRGKTGDIVLNREREVQRKLVFATFANGIPQPLGQ